MTTNFNRKAKEIVDELVINCGLDVGASTHRSIESVLEKHLIEQDKETRHRCAESVLNLPDQNDLCGDSEVKWIDAEDAHNACINS